MEMNSPFSALTLLVGWQEGHPACKDCVVSYWRGYLSRVRCKCFAYGPPDATVFMVAQWNRADHYIFALWFLLLSSFFLFSSPNLSRRRLDVCHTSTHGVALVRI